VTGGPGFVFVAALLLVSSSARAQSIGVFRWQLQPYCNVVTVDVTSVQGDYRLTGFDDQCGGARRAAVTGVATSNRDGSIGIALTSIGAPGGVAVSTTAAISLATLAGTWRDGFGRSGPYVPAAAGPATGSPRPLPPAGSLTSLQTGGGVNGAIAGATLSVSLAFGSDGDSVQAARSDHTHALSDPTSTAVGTSAMEAGSNTYGNTAVGHETLRRVASGSNNAANTAIGARALSSSVTDGNSNIAVGVDALAAHLSGVDNVAVGWRAMAASTSGALNIALGRGALLNTRAPENIGIGQDALADNQTGELNIAIGSLAGSLAGSARHNNLYIRNSGSTNDSGTIRIGNDNHLRAYIGGVAGRQSIGGVPLLINPAGRLGTVMSSARTKQHIAPIGEVADRLARLTPVQFTYTPEVGGVPSEVQYGLVAEEVAAVFPELTVRDADGRPWGVRYHLLVPLLLQEIQRLRAELTALETQAENEARRLAAIEADGARPSRR
jgi:hypothetical protein